MIPLLAIAGRGDGIAPVAACHHLGDLVPNASVALETAPGGHLGVLTGRASRNTTWRLLDTFLDAPARRLAARPAA
jgi:polyhydroxyalkanoate synthase